MDYSVVPNSHYEVWRYCGLQINSMQCSKIAGMKTSETYFMSAERSLSGKFPRFSCPYLSAKFSWIKAYLHIMANTFLYENRSLRKFSWRKQFCYLGEEIFLRKAGFHILAKTFFMRKTGFHISGNKFSGENSRFAYLFKKMSWEKQVCKSYKINLSEKCRFADLFKEIFPR